MSQSSRILKITTLLIGVFSISSLLLWSLPTAEATLPHAGPNIDQRVVVSEQTVSKEPELIGLPCGSGELMGPDTICLHGRVLVEAAGGDSYTALNNIQVDVSFADRTISAFTFLHAGEGEPTYGIDISALEPTFMESVTVTAHISGTKVDRLVSVFPNFDTHNQAYDIIVPDLAAFDGQILWGHVVDYNVGGPVSGAIVTATYGSPPKQVAVTTSESDEHSYPLYSFFAADLPGITSGDAVTLTAGFAEDSYSHVVTIEGDETTQKNLLTGWKCNDFDPFPRFGEGGAFPRFGEGGAFPGFPDAICVWGYGLSNGIPQESVEIEIEIDGQFFKGVTKLFPGEITPRFGIALPKGNEYLNKPMTVTALYNGLTDQTQTLLTPQDSPIQQINLNVLGVGLLSEQVGIHYIHDYVWLDNHLWLATNGGLVRWDPADSSSYQHIDPYNSPLLYFNIYKLDADENGNLYIHFDLGEIQKFTPETNEWDILTPLAASDVITGSAYMWFEKIDSFVSEGETFTELGGLYQFDPISDSWHFHAIEDIPITASEQIENVVIDNSGTSWFEKKNSTETLIYFNNSEQTWGEITKPLAEGLQRVFFFRLSLAPDQTLWMYANHHPSHFALVNYDPTTGEWTDYTSENSPVKENLSGVYPNTMDLKINSKGEVYALIADEFFTLDPDLNLWAEYTHPGDQLLGAGIETGVSTLIFDTDDQLWTFKDGFPSVARWENEFTFELFSIENQGPQNRYINYILEDHKNWIWVSDPRTGISSYDPKTTEWESFNTSNSTLPSNYVSSIAIDRTGKIWASTTGVNNTEGIWTYDPNINESTFNYTSHEPKVVWFDSCECIQIHAKETITHHFGTETPSESWTDFALRGLFAVPMIDGDVWVATWTGITVLDTETGEISPHDVVNAQLILDPVGDIQLNDIEESPDGTVWIAQPGISLYKVDLDGTVTSFTSLNSELPSTNITGLESDAFGRIWITNSNSRDNLSVYDPIDESWNHFSPTQKLTSRDYDTTHLTVGKLDDLWLSTTNGLAHWYMPIQHADSIIRLEGPTHLLESGISPLEYTITVSNGGEIASFIRLDLNFPPTSTVVGSDIPLPIVSGSSIDLGVFKAGESKEYALVIQPAEGWEAGQAHNFKASVDGGNRESIFSNNEDAVVTKIVAPNQIDLSISVIAPPTLIPGEPADLSLTIANEGTKASLASSASLQLPDGLTLSQGEPIWEIPSLQVGESYVLTTTIFVDAELELTMVQIGAEIEADPAEANMLNNAASINLPISASGVRTLILVAPDRLATHYAPSTVINQLYSLAEHTKADGLVINLENEEEVQAAYVAWDAAPADWTRANQTAEAIQSVLKRYLETYDTVEYIVLVGGDSIIPHYRMADHNETQWQERNYAIQVEGHSAVHAAMLANKILTDDFYADPNPQVPDSYFWTYPDPVFVPDYALGRLVETPEEISAVLDSFLTHDGVIQIEDAVLGGDDFLASDLVAKQCDLMGNSGLTANCANNDVAFSHIFEQTTPNSAWTSFHSNHYSMGLFGESMQAHDLFNIQVSDTLMGTIGCHAGLNVSDNQLRSDLDLVQGIAYNGGTTIGSTAYTYGSSWEINYTEALMADFTEKFLAEDKRPIGKVLQAAKRDYFARRAWFGPLDAKTLTPISLYGLPMIEYDLPDNRIQAYDKPESQLQISGKANEIVTINFAEADFEEVVTDDGRYFTYLDQTLAQYHQPIQPAHSESIPYEKDGKVLKGILLHDSTYQDIVDFDPVINESWVMGAQAQQDLVEPVFDDTDWDRDLPVGYTVVEGENGPQATISYVPGLFNADSNVERLFGSISVELLYGDADDADPAYLTFAELEKSAGETAFKIGVDKEQELVDRVFVIYEVSNGWASLELEYNQQLEAWTGTAPAEVSRYRIQVVDHQGNLNDPGWLVDGFGDSPSNLSYLYLPTIQR